MPRFRLRLHRRTAWLGLLLVLAAVLDYSGTWLTLSGRLPWSRPTTPAFTPSAWAPQWQHTWPEVSGQAPFQPLPAAVSRDRQALPRAFDAVVLQEVCAPVLWASPSHAAAAARTQSSWWHHRWQSAGAQATWPSPQSLNCPQLPSPAPDTPLAAAHRRLEAVVRATGLAGLHVPAWIYTSPQRLDQLGTELLQQQDRLRRVTGWTGPVLGLAGRVVLNLRPSHQPDRQADAWVDLEGLIHITGEVVSLPHEWFHALDFMVAAGHPHPFPFLPASSQFSRWDGETDDPMRRTWDALAHPTWTPVQWAQLNQDAQVRLAIHTTHRNLWFKVDPQATEVAAWDTLLTQEHDLLAARSGTLSPWIEWRRRDLAQTRWLVPPATWDLAQLPPWLRAQVGWRPWDPSEVLADAFAHLVHPPAAPADAPLWRQPLTTERAHHQVVMRGLFDTLAPRWHHWQATTPAKVVGG